MIGGLLQSAPAWAWIAFHGLILFMLALDLGVMNRKAHAPTFKEAAAWSVVWISLALAFNGIVIYGMGSQHGVEWFSAYLLEKSLSVDNLFVIVLLFSAFQVELKNQHRILYWGILGALVMRAAMILAGTALLNRFEWMIWVFGGFLVYTGVKMFFFDDQTQADPTQSGFARLFRRIAPFDPQGGHTHFLVRKGGRWLFTPMFLVLLMVELTDLVFAVDSIPAVLALTRDPFIVYTSNIFAILGLRSLYFLLAKLMDRFHYLKVGLAIVLTFVGVKMCIAKWCHIPIGISLGVFALVLGGAVAASLMRPKA